MEMNISTATFIRVLAVCALAAAAGCQKGPAEKAGQPDRQDGRKSRRQDRRRRRQAQEVIRKDRPMLHEFLTSNREELIRRCRAKVNQRSSPPTPSALEHGVPLFLGQLVEALLYERVNPAPKHDVLLHSSRKTPGSIESGRTARLHGKELLDDGYTIDQVVHGYGDVCQSVTELAIETKAPITVAEFHLFNRLLDNAIAEAVSSFGHHRDASISAVGALDLHDRMGSLAEEQRKLWIRR